MIAETMSPLKTSLKLTVPVSLTLGCVWSVEGEMLPMPI